MSVDGPYSGELDAAIRASRDRVTLRVWAKPGASRDGLVGVRNGHVEVAVTAPADRGKANAAIAALLARVLRVSRGDIALVAGPTSRRKLFAIDGVQGDDVRAALGQGLPPRG
ncbi:DUF167 family protein [Botrimarina sp.]|uniref:DUF167 domain-containing protein n=1 Tax=Botrimarina sp. TaxID=2795802 RepID=UPI0032EF90BA